MTFWCFNAAAEGQATSGAQWMNLRELVLEDSETWGEEGDEDLPADDLPDEHGSAPRRHERKGVIAINEYFADHPEMVLGTHGQRRGIYGPGFLLHLPAGCRSARRSRPSSTRR